MTECTEGTPEPTLRRISEISSGYMDSRCLMAAVQLGLFTCIAKGHATVGAIASAAEISERGARPLLDTLVAMGLLSKTGDAYALNSGAERYLVKGRPDYIGSTMENDSLWESWTHLAERVRTGKPAQPVGSQEKAETFFPALNRSRHIYSTQPARMAARALAERVDAKPMRILDVACGSGIWGISLAEEREDARLTLQDFPGIFKVTREYVERHGLEGRIGWLPGDLKQVEFGEGRFDVAMLGNIVHSEGEASSRELFKRLYRALAPGGRIAIIDMIPNEERTGPLMPVRFALVMLLSTEQGGTYTLNEYTEWLEAAGFREVETISIDSHSPMIVAKKP